MAGIRLKIPIYNACTHKCKHGQEIEKGFQNEIGFRKENKFQKTKLGHGIKIQKEFRGLLYLKGNMEKYDPTKSLKQMFHSPTISHHYGRDLSLRKEVIG